MEDPVDIGNLVRERREARGMSQEVLAEKIGATQATIDKIEHGRSKKSRFLVDVFIALELPFDKLPAPARNVEKIIPVAWKVLSALFFQEPLSIIAVVLIVIAVCAIEYFAYQWAGAAYGRGAARAMIGGGASPSNTLLVFLAALAVLVLGTIVALIIAFGFSQEFWSATFRGYSYDRYRHLLGARMILFILMIGLPIAVNAAVFALATNSILSRRA